jgi:NADH-quinone oxidoreductase subunit E
MEIPTETKNLIQKRIGEIRQQYPEAQAACLPALHVAQQHLNYVSDDVLDLVADTLTLPSAFVQGVATFYTMYNTRTVGRYHLQLCTNVSCMLEGAEELLMGLEKHLGIKAGETTSDGVFTLDEVECLAACGTGPVLQINDKYHETMDLEKAIALLDDLKSKSESRDIATPNADLSKIADLAKAETKPIAKAETKPIAEAETKPIAKAKTKDPDSDDDSASSDDDDDKDE